MIGRGSQTRTDTGVNPQDFESSASTSSAIPPSDNGDIDIIIMNNCQQFFFIKKNKIANKDKN